MDLKGDNGSGKTSSFKRYLLVILNLTKEKVLQDGKSLQGENHYIQDAGFQLKGRVSISFIPERKFGTIKRYFHLKLRKKIAYWIQYYDLQEFERH